MSPPHPALLQMVAGVEVGTPTDEAELVRSTHEHRMVAAVLDAHERGIVTLSSGSITTLAIEDLAERELHLRIWEALGHIQAMLQAVGAEVAVVKGIATEARWYDGLGQRCCTDLDLLLDPSDCPRAAAVVAALDPSRGCLPAIEWLVPRRLLQHVDLRLDDVAVDLHFDPLKIGMPTRQLKAVWASTEQCETPYGSIRVLAAEVELVLLLLHMNKDGFALLGPFLDIQRMVTGASLDWDRVRDFVTGEGLDVPVWKSLGVVAGVVPLDADGLPAIGGLRGWTWDRLWGGDAILRGEVPEGRRPVQPLLALHASGRPADKLRELRRQLVPQRPLLEVAGRLEPGESYLRHVGINGLRRRNRHPT